jgi:DNA repair protein RecN (Recombination protein N)
MLTLLQIENIAIIESAELTFDRNFHVLTGETGAGKSIIIDALGAVLGARTSRELIRTGAESGRVSAVFARDGEEDEWLLTREIHADGRSICRINGKPATAAMLRETGALLCHIYGQHDSTQLLREETHLEYLDQFAGLDDERTAYTAVFERYIALRKERESLLNDGDARQRRAESLRHAIHEIESAAPQPNEEETLTARRTLLRNAGRVTGALEEAYSALHGGDDAEGAVSLLEIAAAALLGVAAFSGDTDDLHKRAADLSYLAGDLARDLSGFREGLDFSPTEAEEIENRLDLLRRLTKKYGPDLAAYANQAAAELASFEDAAGRLEALNAAMAEVRTEARNRALALSERRRTAAAGLQEQMEETLRELDMARVCFVVEFEAEEKPRLRADGMDLVRFLLSANLGEDPRPLSKIASGGELSRIMLAMRCVAPGGAGVMVFDEIDAGVSGRAAGRLAEKLKQVSGRAQVLCVTHLPQIAAAAEAHSLIQKCEQGGRTVTSVIALGADGRASEIARLIGGTHITPNVLRTAKEMLGV